MADAFQNGRRKALDALSEKMDGVEVENGTIPYSDKGRWELDCRNQGLSIKKESPTRLAAVSSTGEVVGRFDADASRGWVNR